MGNKIDLNTYQYNYDNGVNNNLHNMSSPYNVNSIYNTNYNYEGSYICDTFESINKKNNDNKKLLETNFYGIEKYNTLTDAEKIKLRSSINEPGKIKDILHMTDIIENNLNQRFPNGFKIVGIGRSPSLIIEILKAKGYDALSCPISNLTNGEYDITGKYSYLKQLAKQDVIEYKEALESLGISADKIKNIGKPTIFVDYTRTGNSLMCFQDLIARPEIGIDKRYPIEFLSLNKDLMPNKTLEDITLINKYWENLGIKDYSFMPKLDIANIGNVKDVLKNFNPKAEASKFLLQIIDVIKTIK